MRYTPGCEGLRNDQRPQTPSTRRNSVIHAFANSIANESDCGHTTLLAYSLRCADSSHSINRSYWKRIDVSAARLAGCISNFIGADDGTCTFSCSVTLRHIAG
jgi:hypothetical protein